MVKLLDKDIRKYFFGLDYSSQIKIFNLYRDELDENNCIFFDKVFSNYMDIIKNLIAFKNNFYKFDAQERKNLRDSICKCKLYIEKEKLCIFDKCVFSDALNDSINFSDSNFFDSRSIDRYEHDFFSYSRIERCKIALELARYYSEISDFKFQQLLQLCDGKKGMFDNEIKKISNNFYGLYYSMDIVERMIYIGCFASLDPYRVNEINARFLNYMRQSDMRQSENPRKKILSKYFNVDAY